LRQRNEKVVIEIPLVAPVAPVCRWRASINDLGLGIAALFGIRKHGRKGILAPALAGLVLNGLLLFIFITNFVAARAAAHTH
jgi:hypothetical protein